MNSQTVLDMGRRKDPNYTQVCGMVPKELATELKVACLRSEINLGEALEQAITAWLENQNTPPPKSKK